MATSIDALRLGQIALVKPSSGMSLINDETGVLYPVSPATPREVTPGLLRSLRSGDLVLEGDVSVLPPPASGGGVLVDTTEPGDRAAWVAGMGLGVNFANWRDGSPGGRANAAEWSIARDAGLKTALLPFCTPSQASFNQAGTISAAFMAEMRAAVDTALTYFPRVIYSPFQGYKSLMYDGTAQGNPVQWGYEPQFSTSYAVHRQRFLNMWQQIANSFKDVSKRVSFKLLNEPFVDPWQANNTWMTDAAWSALANDAIAIIRATGGNAARQLVVGPGWWNSASHLEALALSSWTNVIAEVHCYAPHVWTHAGAWANPTPVDAYARGTWCDDTIDVQIAQAAAWGAAKGVPVIIGETGQFLGNASTGRLSYMHRAIEAGKASGTPVVLFNWSADWALNNPDSAEFWLPGMASVLDGTYPYAAPADNEVPITGMYWPMGGMSFDAQTGTLFGTHQNTSGQTERIWLQTSEQPVGGDIYYMFADGMLAGNYESSVHTFWLTDGADAASLGQFGLPVHFGEGDAFTVGQAEGVWPTATSRMGLSINIPAGVTLTGPIAPRLYKIKASSVVAVTWPSAPVVATATVGQQASVSGTANGTAPIAYSYQWTIDGVNISGANASTYTPVAGNSGKALRCVVAAANARGSVPSTSNAVTVASAPAQTAIAVNSMLVFDGDSLMADGQGEGSAFVGHSPAFWTAFYSRGTLRTYNAAWGGTRVTSGANAIGGSTRLTNVLSKSPAIVCDISGHNDLSDGSTTAATLQAAQQTRFNALFAGGVQYIVAGTIPPVAMGGASLWTTAIEAQRTAYNTWLKGRPAADSRFRVVDLDTVGLVPETDYFDTTHYRQAGAQRVGEALAVQIDALVEDVDVLAGYNTAANLLGSRALMTGAGGTKTRWPDSTQPAIEAPLPTGTVPDGFMIGNHISGVSITTSVTTLNGAPALRVVGSGTSIVGGSNYCDIWITQFATLGAGVAVEGLVDVSIAAGSQNLWSIGEGVDAPDGTSLSAASGAGSPYPVRNVAASGVIRTRPAQVTPAAAPTLVHKISINVDGAGKPVAFDVTFARPLARV